MGLTLEELEQALGVRKPVNPAHEKRREKRYTFPRKQHIAFCDDGRVPAADEFETVDCRDLSAIGLSFYTPGLPLNHANHVVCALGNPADATYMRARIVHITRTDYKNKAGYLVGCEFTGRV